MNHADTEALKDFFLHDEFARQNGIEIVEIAEGYARTQVRIEPCHLHRQRLPQRRHKSLLIC